MKNHYDFSSTNSIISLFWWWQYSKLFFPPQHRIISRQNFPLYEKKQLFEGTKNQPNAKMLYFKMTRPFRFWFKSQKSFSCRWYGRNWQCAKTRYSYRIGMVLFFYKSIAVSHHAHELEMGYNLAWSWPKGIWLRKKMEKKCAKEFSSHCVIFHQVLEQKSYWKNHKLSEIFKSWVCGRQTITFAQDVLPHTLFRGFFFCLWMLNENLLKAGCSPNEITIEPNGCHTLCRTRKE